MHCLFSTSFRTQYCQSRFPFLPFPIPITWSNILLMCSKNMWGFLVAAMSVFYVPTILPGCEQVDDDDVISLNEFANSDESQEEYINGDQNPSETSDHHDNQQRLLDDEWYEEQLEDDLKWSFSLNSVLHEVTSEFQHIALLDTKRFGKVLLIDGKIQTDLYINIQHHKTHFPICGRIYSSCTILRRFMWMGFDQPPKLNVGQLHERIQERIKGELQYLDGASIVSSIHRSKQDYSEIETHVITEENARFIHGHGIASDKA